MRFLVPFAALLVSGVSHAAVVSLAFEGELLDVTAASTVAYGAANPAYLSAPAAYSGTIEYDADSGEVLSGELSFASGYALNNHHDFIPTLARIERSWGPVTYALSGTMVATGGSVSLLIGNELVPGVTLAGDAEVQAVGSASLAPAIFGDIPTCTAFDPARQSTNCSHAPGEEILGLDSFLLEVSLATNTHVLAMDEVIEHCGGRCSTEWWHISGEGSATVSAVPVPAAAWLFGSALAGLGWVRRKRLP